MEYIQDTLAENDTWWNLQPEINSPEDEVECAECKVRSKASEWKIVYLPCGEYCEHSGAMCPNCFKAYDHVWDSEVLLVVYPVY